ncbi:MAG: amidase [Deltaproteobacteria bacterium]
MSSDVRNDVSVSRVALPQPVQEADATAPEKLEVPFAPTPAQSGVAPKLAHGGSGAVTQMAQLRSSGAVVTASVTSASKLPAVTKSEGPQPVEIPGVSAKARELGKLSATETAAAIRSGELSRQEVVEAAIERAEASQGTIHGIASRLYDRARAQAAGPGNGGPLDGVPTAIKDIVPLEGLITTYGSEGTPRIPAKQTSDAVRDFEGLGGISIARSTSSEFGYTCTVEPPGKPPTRNPYDLTRSAGGSSGGAASLVAAGVISYAHTTDGGGSTRIPANWCGLYGMKPTRGRQTSLASAKKMPVEINAAGAVTRTAEDLAAVMHGLDRGALSGMRPLGLVEGPSNERLRVGFYIDPLDGKSDPDVARAVLKTAEELEKQGHIVEEMKPPYDESFVRDFLQHYALIALITELKLRFTDGADIEKLEPFSRDLANLAKKPLNLLTMPFNVWRLDRFEHEYAKIFESRDIVLSPTTATTAPELGHLSPEIDFDTHLERLLKIVAFTPLQNGSGGPALSVPSGFSEDGLPIGVQLASNLGEDRRLIELAFALKDYR